MKPFWVVMATRVAFESLERVISEENGIWLAVISPLRFPNFSPFWREVSNTSAPSMAVYSSFPHSSN